MRRRLWNPRYVGFARAHGRSPQKQLDFDKASRPSGCMADFICWTANRLSELRASLGYSRFQTLELKDQESFDLWLKRYVDQEQS